MSHRHRVFPGSLVIVAALCATPAIATTVAPMTVGSMADYAGQVIAGDVIEVRSYWTGDPRRIESEVVFANVDYLKGVPAGAGGTFTLTVPGGAIGELEMRIAGAPQFAVGDSWVLFLLPAYKTFPVVGLSQGAFRIVPGPDGVERVHQAGLPVTGLDAGGFVEVTTSGAAPRALESGRPGARVTVHPVPAETALSHAEFLNLIGPILRGSRHHGLKEPAGRPVPVRYTPARLRGAGAPLPALRRGVPAPRGERASR
ncbi:MAG: hypothetical protein ACYS1B_18280 [Planctomycetota bacterium]|jgi:hypothetical protein